MKKTVISTVAVLFLGVACFAQDAAKTAPKTKGTKTEAKASDAKAKPAAGKSEAGKGEKMPAKPKTSKPAAKPAGETKSK